jgi:hypothetical protein
MKLIFSFLHDRVQNYEMYIAVLSSYVHNLKFYTTKVLEEWYNK